MSSRAADSAISTRFSEGFVKVAREIIDVLSNCKAAVTLIYDVAIHTRYRSPVPLVPYKEFALREFYHSFSSPSPVPLNVGVARSYLTIVRIRMMTMINAPVD